MNDSGPMPIDSVWAPRLLKIGYFVLAVSSDTVKIPVNGYQFKWACRRRWIKSSPDEVS